MATNYDKYIRSTGTHYISNSGSDEHGAYTGGKAGDQTGKEWQLRSWYSRPWTVVLRYPDQAVAGRIAELGIAAALNDRIGYDQSQRTTYWTQLKAAGYDPSKIAVACEEDCTAGVSANVRAAGYSFGIEALKGVPICTSRNMRRLFEAAGFTALTASKYLTGGSYLLPGDILLYENHHAATNVTCGKAVRNDWRPGTALVGFALGERILRNGDAGADVRAMQAALIELGHSCGSWGADGEFGDATELALRAFQRARGCDVDGEYGPQTHAALMAALNGPADGAKPRTVSIVGGDCYVRDAPDKATGKPLGVAFEGSLWDFGGEVAENGWIAIWHNNALAWVSGKYGRLVA